MPEAQAETNFGQQRVVQRKIEAELKALGMRDCSGKVLVIK
jgi:hypothetical protein